MLLRCSSLLWIYTWKGKCIKNECIHTTVSHHQLSRERKDGLFLSAHVATWQEDHICTEHKASG